MSAEQPSSGIAVMNWMRPEPVEASIERAARLGYSAVELIADPASLDPAAVRAALEEHGIACWGAATLMKDGRDLVHPDSYIRRATLDYVQDAIRWAAALGGSIVTITPAIGKLGPAAEPKAEWRWAVESLRAAQELAGELGLRIGMEVLCRFETYFCNRTEIGLELAAEVGNGFGVVLDVFHMNIEEADLGAAIEAAGPLLVDFHVADSNRRPPGQGALHWERVFEALAATGYGGCLTVEFFYGDMESSEQYEADVAAALAFLRQARPDPTALRP